MLTMIKLHDYAHYSKDVEKLRGLLNERTGTADEKMILDFFVSSQEAIASKLDTLPNSAAYWCWCLSDDGQEISLFANSLAVNRHSLSKEIDELIRSCAEQLAYLLTYKCAQFYTED